MSADDGQYSTDLSTNVVTGKLDVCETMANLKPDLPDKANDEECAP